VKVRYYDSTFFGHGTHTDLLKHFKTVTDDLQSNKVYQISMDGPNVNLKFYNEFSAKFKEENCHSSIDIGTCSLHTVHNSFRTGAEKTG
jgi:hypothetical protein